MFFRVLLQRQHGDGQRRDAGVPGGTGGPPGRAAVPRAGGGRPPGREGPRRHAACARRRADRLPRLPPVDGEPRPSYCLAAALLH